MQKGQPWDQPRREMLRPAVFWALSNGRTEGRSVIAAEPQDRKLAGRGYLTLGTAVQIQFSMLSKARSWMILRINILSNERHSNMSFVSAADIMKLGIVAFQLWEYGFSKCRNAEKQYADFGSDIQYLARNLEKLSKVIQDVTRQIPKSLAPEDHAWDLKSLLKICGDFRKTIRECKILLYDHSKFGRGCGGFVYNIQWNLTVEPEVRRLRDRVAFHNIKISTVLKPLEIKLMLDLKDEIFRVHSDLALRITNVHESVLEVLRKIEGHFTANAHEASAQAQASPPLIPRVPDYLETRFELAAKASNPELLDEKNFPFYKGVNAFHHHFEQGTALFKPEETSTEDFFTERTPEPAQYLNLMKSIWIIQEIKKGDEWREASVDRLSECYMNELEARCLQEFSRFTAKEEPRKRLLEPDKRNISLLREEEFRIWLDEEDEDDGFRSTADYLNEILRVSLLSTSRHTKSELVLIRKSDTKLQIQKLSSKIVGAPNREIDRDNLNLERVYCVPLYASPKSTPEALNLVFRGEEDAEEDTALSFLKLKDLLDFQQAITGHKVVLDQPDIRTLFLQATGCFGGKKTAEIGRIQIWVPKRLERRIPQVQSPGMNSFQQRPSVASGSSTAVSVTKTFSTAHTSPVENENTMSYNFELPGMPILVLYLTAEGNDEEEMSFLTMQRPLPFPPCTESRKHLWANESNLVDKRTKVTAKCGCDRRKQTCMHSTISRPGELLARRVNAANGRPLNLARLGKYQTWQVPDYEGKLKWLHIDFTSQEAREKFEHEFDQTKEIYNEKLIRYHGEMSREKQDHIG